MLHLVVNTHNAESCAFRGPEEEGLLVGAADRFADLAKERGMSTQGTWVSRATHEVFFLIEAPDGHAIERALLDAGLVGRSHSRILPVVDADRAMEKE